MPAARTRPRRRHSGIHGAGLLPGRPGSNEYVIGRPFVNRAVLKLASGKTFTIRAENLSDANGYVGKVTLNGRPLERSFIRHEEIVAGRELVFTMQAEPNKEWGRAKGTRPYSLTGC